MQIGASADPALLSSAYHVFEWNHAQTLLSQQFPDAYADVISVLSQFRLYRTDILDKGGGKSRISKGLEVPLKLREWKQQTFHVRVLVNDKQTFEQVRTLDHVKGRVALEIEWNNKLPFFDRDLDNFRFLHRLGSISAGIIITRFDDLQSIFKELGKGEKYGPSTTHFSKLIAKIQAGGGAGCPILVFGLAQGIYVDDTLEDV